MGLGVLLHRTDSKYNDVPWEKYQFPQKYLSRMRDMVGSLVIYLEPTKVKNTKGYFAMARVQEIVTDPVEAGMYFAIIEVGSYQDFGTRVPFRLDGEILERGVLNDAGNISGRAQAAVRPLSAEDFIRIKALGLGCEDDVLPRQDIKQQPFEWSEAATDFSFPIERLRMDQVVNRAVRDRNFRRVVLGAYGERCAITGLRLINGGGRAEVEAAHIRPVEKNGPDIVSNGIALSGTAHWMFDRGLIGLNDEHKIMVSRQANDTEAVNGMINATGHLILPKMMSERPRKEFVSWHYENCFKH